MDIPVEWIVSKEEWNHIMKEFLKRDAEAMKKNICNKYFKGDNITDFYFDMKSIKIDFNSFEEDLIAYERGLRYEEEEATFFITDDGTPGYVLKDEEYKISKTKDFSYG